jgi:hypothetical protein
VTSTESAATVPFRVQREAPMPFALTTLLIIVIVPAPLCNTSTEDALFKDESMTDRNRSWLEGSRASILALLVVIGFGVDARGAAIFSYTVGRTFAAPTDGYSDAGITAADGFPLTAGSYSAGTSPDYFNGTSWQQVPDGWTEAVVISSGQWYPVAPLSGDTMTSAMTINSLGHLVGNSMTSLVNDWITDWQTSPGTRLSVSRTHRREVCTVLSPFPAGMRWT